MIKALSAGLLCASVTAQSFSYPDFSSVAQLNLLGDAAHVGNAVRLTANVSSQSGWFWRQTAMPVVYGFDTTFTFRVTPSQSGTKGEGMAFVIQDDPAGASAIGGTVWGLGYGDGANGNGGIRNSIAIEIDTYLDPFLNDTSANELSVHTLGTQGNNESEAWSIGRTTPANNFADGQVHTVRVHYVPGTLGVYVDNIATPALSVPYDFVTGGQYVNGNNVGGLGMATGAGFVGFCATTGAGNLTELVEILSWDWTSEPLLDPCYAGTLGQDTLTIDGDDGGYLRRVELATYQPFSIWIGNPPGFGVGAPYVLLGSLVAQPGALGGNLGFGSACFPMFPTGPAEILLADPWFLGPALLPAGPTPHAIAIPQGAIAFPVELTLQAVTLATPTGLGLTNALELAIAPVGPPQVTTVDPSSASAPTVISIRGSGFVPGVVVTVGGVATNLLQVTPELLQFVYPMNVGCDTQLVVTNPDGQSVSATLNPNPTVTSTLLNAGPAAGNAIFIIQGTGFAPGMSVTIGGNAAMIISSGPTIVRVRTPAGTPGVAPVVVTTPGGCSVTTSYTYL